MLTAILVDDEIMSLNSLRLKISGNFPEIQVLAACTSAGDGLGAIEEMHPDIVFLDIEMPIMNGFTMLQSLQYRSFEIIFVTAYDHYAIKAIKYSALDYLIKPVEIEELSQAIDKAIQKRESSSNQRLELLLENLRHDSKEIRKIAISSPEGLQFVRLENLLYLEATGNYTHVHTCDKKKYLSSHSLKIFEEILPVHQFLRIHNSYIINLDYVVKYIRGEGGKVVLEGNVNLDISKRKKADFLKAIRM